MEENYVKNTNGSRKKGIVTKETETVAKKEYNIFMFCEVM